LAAFFPDESLYRAAILAIVALAYPDRLHTFLLACGGSMIGWIAATIERSAYPPPKPKLPVT
jgi:hypothetical protein